MNKLLVIVFTAWALGMFGLWLSSIGYATLGKLLIFVFGPIGIICIFIGLFSFIRERFFSDG